MAMTVIDVFTLGQGKGGPGAERPAHRWVTGRTGLAFNLDHRLVAAIGKRPYNRALMVFIIEIVGAALALEISSA